MNDGADRAIRDRVIAFAGEEGFPLVRIASAHRDEAVAGAARAALAAGHLAELGWMTAAWLERATDPESFLPGARAVVLVALPYRPQPAPSGDGPITRGRVAAYAAGRDYHRVFEGKLRRIARRMRDELQATARPTVDYGPLLERPLAARAGLGWQGKSTMLLAPGFGPWVMLGAIATDLALTPDLPLRKSCGSCSRCITACPTGALNAAGGVLDARRCISYHTIENRGPIPRELRSAFGGWIFGCDLCLDACPPGWRPFDGDPALAAGESEPPALAPLLGLDEAAFAARFAGRPIRRAKRDGLLRNVCVALGNTGSAADLAPLLGALDDRSPLVRGHAAWGCARLGLRLGAGSLSSVRSALEQRRAIESDPFVIDEIESALASLRDLSSNGSPVEPR